MEKTKVFISVPMNGREEKDIRDDLTKARTWYLVRTEKPLEDVWFYDNLDGGKKAMDFEKELAEQEGATLIPPKDDKLSVWYLGIALTNLAYSDEAIFCKGWENARGCQFEHEVCIKYGIPVKYITYQ